MTAPFVKITHADDEKICAIAWDENGNIIELFKLNEGHAAFKQNWSDERVIEYLRQRLIEAGRTVGDPKFGVMNVGK